MSAILRAEIPDEALESMDALIAWAATGAEEAYSDLPDVREAVGVSNPPIAAGEFKDLDRFYRLSVRVNLRLASGYQASSNPIWEDVIPLANRSLPQAWKKV